MELLIMAPMALIIILVLRRKRAFKVHWQPGRHTWTAVAVGLMAFVLSCLLLAFPAQSWIRAAINYVGIWTICGFALPWYYALRIEKSGPAAMGLSRERLRLSLSLKPTLLNERSNNDYSREN